MKRFHVNVAVADLEQSIGFYSTLFGEQPAVRKHDYAKWMLDDPRVNFSIALSAKARGVNHVGLQADSMPELGEIQARLHAAGESTLEQPGAECCYARSSKTWVRDPDGLAWETFVTHEDLGYFGNDGAEQALAAVDAKPACCA
jgi:catechol 2,3-dioxygenase-like lactoylglutathione lyase family enzyme